MDNFDTRFVTAYSKTTGRKQRIPRHWLDNPRLGADFALPPSAKTGGRTRRDTSTSSSTETPATTPVTEETPPVGDDEGAQ